MLNISTIEQLWHVRKGIFAIFQGTTRTESGRLKKSRSCLIWLLTFCLVRRSTISAQQFLIDENEISQKLTLFKSIISNSLFGVGVTISYKKEESKQIAKVEPKKKRSLKREHKDSASEYSQEDSPPKVKVEPVTKPANKQISHTVHNHKHKPKLAEERLMRSADKHSEQWTQAEDRKLLGLYETFDGDWDSIAKFYPDKSADVLEAHFYSVLQ